MEFIKKNPGFVVFSTVCLVLVILLSALTVQKLKAASTSGEKIAELQKFFGDMSRKDYSVTEANLAKAKNKLSLVQAKTLKERAELAARYSIPSQFLDRIDCAKTLTSEVTNWNSFLQKKGVMVNTQAAAFSFSNIIMSKQPPKQEMVPHILKHKEIVGELIHQVAEAKLSELSEIKRYGGYILEDKIDYRTCAYKVDIKGGYVDIQNFVNNLQNHSKYLFYLRTLSITSVDQAPTIQAPIKTDVPNDTGRRTGTRYPDEDSMMQPGMYMPGAANSTDETEQALERPDSRRERIALSPHFVQATLDIEFVEFVKPEFEETE